MILSQRALQLLRYVLVAASLTVLFYLISQVGLKQVFLHLSKMHLGWLSATFTCMVLVLCFATLRYRCLIATKLPFTALLEVILASFVLNYAAMVQGLGLGAKVAMLKTRQVPVSYSSAGIWLEICLDILVCSAIVVVLLLTMFESSTNSFVLVAIPLIFIAAVSLVFFILHRNPGRFAIVDQFIAAFREVSSVSRLSSALMYTIGIWMSGAGGFYCLLNALQSGVAADLGLSVLAITSGFLTGLVSMVPGGIGVRELTWSYVVSQGGYPLELAGLAAILNRLFSILTVSVMLFALSLTKTKAT